MDDSVLFANDIHVLERARESIETWLKEHRRLALKHGGIGSTRAPVVFLGYRIGRAGITPSRKLRRRMHKNVRRAAARGPDAIVRTVRSYRGLLAGPV